MGIFLPRLRCGHYFVISKFAGVSDRFISSIANLELFIAIVISVLLVKERYLHTTFTASEDRRKEIRILFTPCEMETIGAFIRRSTVNFRIAAGRSLKHPSVSGQVHVFKAVTVRQRLLRVRASPRQAEGQCEHQKRIKMFHNRIFLIIIQLK